MNPLRIIDRYTVAIIAVLVTSPRRQETIHQFVKFCLIGVVNTAIDFGIYYVLTRHTDYFAVHYLIANIISFVSGTTFSFFANRTWTFSRTDKATVGEASRFYATTISGLGLGQLMLYVLVQLFGINDLVSKVFTTIVTIFWNFLFKKFFVFTPPKQDVQ